MPSDIHLIRFTQKGIENIKEGAARPDVVKQSYKGMGAEVRGTVRSETSRAFLEEEYRKILASLP